MYKTNSLDQRISKNGPLSAKFFFFYDPAGQLIGEYRDNSSTATPADDWLVRKETIWLEDIPVAVIRKPTATSPIQIYFIHTDHLNTPRVIVNCAAAVSTGVGAISGAAIDIASQLLSNGGNLQCIDTGSVAISAGMSAIPVGAAGAIGSTFLGNIAAKGILTQNGLKITGFTGHGVNRAIGNGIERTGVSPQGIIDALRNPLRINDIKTDQLGRQSQRFIGKTGKIVVNPQTGKIISVNPTSTNKVERLIRQ